MAFYLRPPSGNISLEKLETFACRRLGFLIKVLETDKNGLIFTDLLYNDLSLITDSDCLIEGTKKDKISHFILRMAFSEFDDLWEWFENAETILFNFRFLCMKPDEILESLKPVWRTIGRLTLDTDINLLSLEGALQVLQDIPSTCGTWSDVIDKYFRGNETEYFIVPFLYTLELIRKRNVVIKRGKALVPFSKLHNVMTSIFQKILHFSRPKLQEILRNLDDERIFKLFHQLQRYLKSKVLKTKFYSEMSFSPLSHEAVDDEVQFFPPCMANSHKQLRFKHRLKHQARIRYTLFLKEAGLSIHEALMFWRNEYSQKCTDHKEIKCFHIWEKDAKRYMYNIRHLYGMEGGRKNYRAHNCHSLQTSCGGCPFVEFDEAHLKDLLNDGRTNSDHEKIISLVRQNKPTKACSVFFWEKLNTFTQSEKELSRRNREKRHSSNTESENIQSTGKLSSTSSRQSADKHCTQLCDKRCTQLCDKHCTQLCDKHCTQLCEVKQEIQDLTLCEFQTRNSSLTDFKDNHCDLHKEQESLGNNMLQKFPETHQIKESVFEESMTFLLSEKLSCLSSSDRLSESLQNGGDLPSSALKINSNMHSNFSDFESQNRLPISDSHEGLTLSDNEVCTKISHTRPIEFYKNLKTFLEKPKS